MNINKLGPLEDEFSDQNWDDLVMLVTQARMNAPNKSWEFEFGYLLRKVKLLREAMEAEP